jgi:L-asparaginase II
MGMMAFNLIVCQDSVLCGIHVNECYPLKTSINTMSASLDFIRDGIVEATHPMHWVVIGQQGVVQGASGERDEAPFYARSCLKPIQMAVLQEALRQENPKFLARIPPECWAVGMGSHAGEYCHIQAVQTWLALAEVSPDTLHCGAHHPISGTSHPQEEIQAWHHNCSGKHAAIVACCTALGWSVSGYTSRSHPYFQALSAFLEALLPEKARLYWGADGCRLPTPALSLHEWGHVFQAFGQHPCGSSALLYMKKNPLFIAGNGRFDTRCMEIEPHLVSKSGAMGFWVAWNRDTNETLVLKSLSGDATARNTYAWWLLAHLGWMDASLLERECPVQDPSPYATVPSTYRAVF